MLKGVKFDRYASIINGNYTLFVIKKLYLRDDADTLGSMKKPTAPEPKKDIREKPMSQSKLALLKAAATVIRELGPRSATLKRIASRVGVTEPAIFRHFPGIDGLFEELFAMYEETQKACVAGFKNDSKGKERLKKGLLGMGETLTEKKDFAYFLPNATCTFREYEAMKKKAIENQAKLLAAMGDCVKEGQKLGEFRSDVGVESLAQAMSGIFCTRIRDWIEGEFDFDLKKDLEKHWKEAERIACAKPEFKTK